MQLILAIEPDRRQAEKISSMVRTHLDADLVIAGSTAKALKALGDRVPDLILTPALLPPADETKLAERLRELGAAADHIQAVTTPILSDGTAGADRERGMLSALRRDRTREPETVGCEPSVFAKQVSSYLQRAAQERETRATVHSEPAEPQRAPQPASESPEPAGPAGDSNSTDWLDIDEVMAAISDPDPTPDKQIATPVHPPAVANAPAQAADLGDVEDPLGDLEPLDELWETFDPSQPPFPALLTRLNGIANAENANR